MLKRIDTVFMPVSSLDRSIPWYTENLGLTLRWRVPGYAALSVGETALTLVEVPQVEPAPHMPFNFYADDIRAVRSRLAERGVAVSELRDHGDLMEFEFTDLDGNKLGLCWFAEK